jgi:hypothetical protein
MVNSSIYSSFLFNINIIGGVYYKEEVYTLLFTYLLLSSLYYHTTYNSLSYYLDQIGCVSVVFYTFYMWITYLFFIRTLYQFTLALIYIVSLSYIIISYFYGKRMKYFSHHPNVVIGNYFHSLLHFSACVGSYSVLVLVSSSS